MRVIRCLWLCTCEFTANLRYITIIYLWLVTGPDEIVSVRPVENRASERYSFPMSMPNVLVVSWKGKTVTRKALHPLNDCRHWVDRGGPYRWWPRRDLAKTRTWFSQRRLRHSSRDSRDIQLEFSLGHEVWYPSHQYPAAVVSIFLLPFRSWGKYCLHHIDTFCRTGRYTHFWDRNRKTRWW